MKNPAKMKFRDFAPAFLQIKTKDAELVPFHLNVAQQKVDEIVEARLAENRPVRLIILKARQEGISTWSLGRMYHTAATTPNTDAMFVAHDDDSSLKLFKRLALMYDMAPAKPMTKYSTKRELDFRNPDKKTARSNPGLLSSCSVATAGRLSLGHSMTLRFLHLSEVARWKDADQVLLGLENALAKGPGSIEIIESTANGAGNEFHRRWLRASDPKTAGEWIAVFLPWWIYPDYSRSIREYGWEPIPSCVENLAEFEKDERRQKRLFQLTDDQLNWRRYTISNDCGNSVDKFKEQFPGTPTEAFLTSGRPVFNVERIQNRIDVLRQADRIAVEERQTQRYQVGNLRFNRGAVEWVAHPSGEVRVYDWPEVNGEYVIGADVAEGISRGDDSDFSTASVMDRFTWKQVAVFEGHLSPAKFAKVLMALGYFYNTALIACEVNNHGHSVNLKLREERYPGQYISRDYDRFGNPIFERHGWETTPKTRPIAIDALDDSINRKLAEINDIPMLQQLLTFVYNPKNGKQEGADGCHDDLVLCQAIVSAVMTHADYRRRGKSQRIPPPKDEGAALHQKLVDLAWKKARKKSWGFVN